MALESVSTSFPVTAKESMLAESDFQCSVAAKGITKHQQKRLDKRLDKRVKQAWLYEDEDK